MVDLVKKEFNLADNRRSQVLSKNAVPINNELAKRLLSKNKSHFMAHVSIEKSSIYLIFEQESIEIPKDVILPGGSVQLEIIRLAGKQYLVIDSAQESDQIGNSVRPELDKKWKSNQELLKFSKSLVANSNSVITFGPLEIEGSQAKEMRSKIGSSLPGSVIESDNALELVIPGERLITLEKRLDVPLGNVFVQISGLTEQGVELHLIFQSQKLLDGSSYDRLNKEKLDKKENHSQIDIKISHQAGMQLGLRNDQILIAEIVIGRSESFLFLKGISIPISLEENRSISSGAIPVRVKSGVGFFLLKLVTAPTSRLLTGPLLVGDRAPGLTLKFLSSTSEKLKLPFGKLSLCLIRKESFGSCLRLVGKQILLPREFPVRLGVHLVVLTKAPMGPQITLPSIAFDKNPTHVGNWVSIDVPVTSNQWRTINNAGEISRGKLDIGVNKSILKIGNALIEINSNGLIESGFCSGFLDLELSQQPDLTKIKIFQNSSLSNSDNLNKTFLETFVRKSNDISPNNWAQVSGIWKDDILYSEWRSIEGSAPMLVPETPLVIGRGMVPDSMPIPLKVGQPIADELGLNPRQVIPVTVESSGEKMSLSVNQKHIELPAHFQVKPGVYSAHIAPSSGGVILQLVSKSNEQANIPASAQALVSPQVAMLMHRPLSKPALLTLFAPGGLEKELASLGFANAADKLASFRLQPSQLTGDSIKQFILSLGLSSEAVLALGGRVNGSHLKLWLRQLIRQLPNQSMISSLLDAALMDMEAGQIDSLQHSQQKEFSFGFVLPFVSDEPVEVDLHRSREGEDLESRWTINVHLMTEALGELWLKSELTNNTVDMTVWARERDTVNLIRSNIAELEVELDLLSFSLASFNIFNAARPGNELPGRHFPGDVVNHTA